MCSCFEDKIHQLNVYLEKYVEFKNQKEIPAKTILLQEGKLAEQYIFIEKGCVRMLFNKNGDEKTVQFFFEKSALTSLESFFKHTPSLFTIETIEPTVISTLAREHIINLIEDLNQSQEFFKTLMMIFVERQLHYMNEFISFIKDTPEQRYLNLLKDRPHVIQRIPQHYIASYLGISRVHLSRIKNKVFKNNNYC